MNQRNLTPRFAWWRNRPYLLLSGIMFTTFLAGGLCKPLFSIRAQDLGATLWEIGLIGTVSQIAGTVVQYFWGRQSDKPICHAAVGLIQEGLRWVSGGKEFRVEETTCIATGDVTCEFLVYKDPIG